MAKMLFETFGIQGIGFSASPLLSMYGSGRMSGLCVQCGHSTTQVVPFYEGFPILNAIVRTEFAGSDVSEYLATLLEARGMVPEGSNKFQEAERVKVKLGECCQQSDQCENPEDVEVRLLCGEALFKPTLAGKDVPGLHELVHRSITICDIDVRMELWGNVVLSGGSTMFLGLRDRLWSELIALAPRQVRGVRVVAAPERRFFKWIGGSILGSLTRYTNCWVTWKDEYLNNGPDFLRKDSNTRSDVYKLYL
eukprot:TRINITY_DN6494_c0_g2_i3.p1 TRINITY_DN6494_c0_g2~~TRINITY_DN6494_c0_g2_i3.p1  ORF type:complete len:251 (-),score=4.27 TRINITY_DN6494_c0_g2_i3:295-1047(-)